MAKGTADSVLVKPAHSQVEYTMETLDQFQKCLDPVSGPTYFMTKFMKIQHPTRGSIAFDPFDYQIELIRNYHEYRFSINLLSRQTGKCVTADTHICLRDHNGQVFHTSVGEFHKQQSQHPENHTHDSGISGGHPDWNEKFTSIVQLKTQYHIHTDTGWEPLTHVNQTVIYQVWKLTLANSLTLECADDHIVFLETGEQVFVKDLNIHDEVITAHGVSRVVDVKVTDQYQRMYDVSVDSENHRFYSNGILSHNTTVAAGYLLWYAMFRPDSTILIAAHKHSGASEIMQRVRYAYEYMPDHIRAGCTEYNKGSITFDNGSRIVATTTTTTTGRGMSLSLVYLDEFAFVPANIAREFWTSLSPTLSTGGKAIITSTPNSDEDTFADIWKKANHQFDEYGNPTELGINGFKPFSVTWEAHPDRDQAWADQERNSIGEERFRREHCNEFIIYEETLINSTKFLELQPSDPVYMQGQIRWYRKPNPQGIYVIALDPSAGTGGDFSAIQVVEAHSLEQVAEWQHNQTPVEGQIRVLMSIMQYLRDHGVYQIYWSLENNTIGEAALVVIRDTGEENFPGEFLTEPRGKAQSRRKGFNTNRRNKNEACVQLKRFIESDKMRIHSRKFISELKTFVAYADTYRAKTGEHDDLVMSMLVVIRMIDFISTFEDTVYDVVNSGLKFDDFVNEYDQPMPMGFM